MKDDVGIAGYQPGKIRRGPHAVFAGFQEKCRLRAALLTIQSELDAAVIALSASEITELQNLMATEINSVDADGEAFRSQVEAESRLAGTTRPMPVQVSRRASAILAQEAERRIARGNYPSSSTLIAEAVERAYAG